VTSPALIAPTEVATTTATVVDVRTPAEFETAHIPDAVDVPLPLVQAHADTRRRPGRPGRAGLPGRIEGGMNAHTAGGHTVRRGKQRWALERQVR
jgi:hypothetical protein